MWRWLQSLWKSDAAEEKPKVAPAHLEPARKAEGVGKSQPHKTPKPTQETSSVPEATPEAATAKQIRFRVQRGQVVGVENTVQRYREDKPVKLHNTPFVERVVTVMQEEMAALPSAHLTFDTTPKATPCPDKRSDRPETMEQDTTAGPDQGALAVTPPPATTQTRTGLRSKAAAVI